METVIEEDIVIVGAGIAGLTTSLGLHRLGVRSLVLESWDSLRVSGFALTIWENAWKALDAVSVGDILRHQHQQLHGNVTTSLITGQQTSTTSFKNNKGKHGAREVRCVRRRLLLEALANQLPSGTIRYLSKVVAIEESGFFKILHLADGTTIKTKVLIGCDGVNSMVAKWLSFKEASYTGRYATRGYVELNKNHEIEPMFMQYFGKGFRAGAIPCDEKGVYWFFTWTPTSKGAGIAGLTTSLGLHRLGVKSLVLESWDSLRVSGFALTLWENAWKALDAVGVGDILRHQHLQLHGIVTTSLVTGQQTSTISFKDNKEKHGAHEVRGVRRRLLLEALANELPSGTIRYLSKVVAIEESGFFKILHLTDGTTIKTKVLIGCDGVNSMVAKWLSFKEASYTGRYAIRGYAELNTTHEIEPIFMQYFGKGFRAGAIPCNQKGVYWFFTWTPINQDKELAQDPAELKQYVLSKLEMIPSDVRYFIEKTELHAFQPTPLRYRHPWELIMGNISKSNVCVAGDALHSMPPDLGEGGCCALEDGVVLARCLGEVFSKKPKKEEIEESLKKYAKERRWRCIDLITTSYIVGFIMQSGSKSVNFIRDTILATFLTVLLLKKSDFDYGQLK